MQRNRDSGAVHVGRLAGPGHRRGTQGGGPADAYELPLSPDPAAGPGTPFAGPPPAPARPFRVAAARSVARPRRNQPTVTGFRVPLPADRIISDGPSRDGDRAA